VIIRAEMRQIFGCLAPNPLRVISEDPYSRRGSVSVLSELEYFSEFLEPSPCPRSSDDTPTKNISQSQGISAIPLLKQILPGLQLVPAINHYYSRLPALQLATILQMSGLNVWMCGPIARIFMVGIFERQSWKPGKTLTYELLHSTRMEPTNSWYDNNFGQYSCPCRDSSSHSHRIFLQDFCSTLF
jgi:hypothetical protein